MIKSMTGFGKHIAKTDNIQAIVEIRTLNSKNADLNIRIPSVLKEKEIEIKQLLLNKLVRGKIDCSISIDFIGEDLPASINKNIVKNYYAQIKEIAKELNINSGELSLQSILRFPDVLSNNLETLAEDDWFAIKTALNSAIENINKFREQEGKALYNDFIERVSNIIKLLKEIEEIEPKRIENIKNRIKNNLEEFVLDTSKIDENRFEQELIYYLEKLDITEEKVRLRNHCKYFLETLDNNGDGANGKKLGFITQEMGREINTLGSKANNVDIQHFVIQMKDELEKIKEQILNIL
jgi:uncharacterized protein (TIGR00255 family)